MELEQFSKDEVDQIIEYGMERGKVILITTLTALALGCIFGILFQGLVFWCSFCLLRRYAGGYHADTQNRCYVISLVVAILSFSCIRWIEHMGTVGFLLQAISLFIILLLAPVENKNRVLDESEKKKYGIKTRVIAVLLSFIYVILCIANRQAIAIPVGIAFLVVAISLITGYIKGVRQKK